MKQEFEIGRQVIHAVLGIIVVLLLYFQIINKWVVLLLAVILAIMFFIRSKWKIEFLDKIIQPFERKRKRHHYEGPLTFFLGSFAVLYVFDMNIALASILIMTLGDSASTVFGTLFGKTKVPWSKKTYVGSFAGIVFAFFGALAFVSWNYALAASIISMIIESFDKDFIDINDNILLPMVAGIVLVVLKFLKF